MSFLVKGTNKIGGQVASKHNYSTTEKVVGTWIDGKPIYEKTFAYGITDLANRTLTVNKVSGAYAFPSDLISTIGEIWIDESRSGIFIKNISELTQNIEIVLYYPLNYPNGSTYVRTNIQRNTSGENYIWHDITYSTGHIYNYQDKYEIVSVIQYTKTTDAPQSIL